MPSVGVAVGQPSGLGTRFDEDGWPLIQATRLTVHRTFEEDEGSRQIICAVNGTRVGQVLFGQRLNVELLPGPQTLRVHNTLVWKTIHFDAPPGSHMHVTVWNRRWAGYITYMMFIGPAPLLLGMSLGSPEVVPRRRKRR